MQATNQSVMNDVRAHYLSPDTAPYPGDKGTTLMPQLSQYLTTTGIHQPITQIYVTTDPLENLPALLFLFTLTLLPQYAYDAHLSVLTPRVRKGTPDACALTVGMITLLRQFHAADTQTYLMYLSQVTAPAFTRCVHSFPPVLRRPRGDTLPYGCRLRFSTK